MTIVETNQKDQLDTLYGAEAIAAFVSWRGSMGQFYYMLQNGYFDADKLGAGWVTTKARLRKQFSGENRFTPSKSEVAVAAPEPIPVRRKRVARKAR